MSPNIQLSWINILHNIQSRTSNLKIKCRSIRMQVDCGWLNLISWQCVQESKMPTWWLWWDLQFLIRYFVSQAYISLMLSLFYYPLYSNINLTMRRVYITYKGKRKGEVEEEQDKKKTASERNTAKITLNCILSLKLMFPYCYHFWWFFLPIQYNKASLQRTPDHTKKRYITSILSVFLFELCAS